MPFILAGTGRVGTETLEEIQAYIEEIGSTSVLIVQNAVVVAVWGVVAHKSNLHSCRRSRLNALIGMPVDEGKINPDDTFEKLGIDDNKPALTPEEKQAAVRDLLEVRSGVYHLTTHESEGDRNKNRLADPTFSAHSAITIST